MNIEPKTIVFWVGVLVTAFLWLKYVPLLDDSKWAIGDTLGPIVFRNVYPLLYFLIGFFVCTAVGVLWEEVYVHFFNPTDVSEVALL